MDSPLAPKKANPFFVTFMKPFDCKYLSSSYLDRQGSTLPKNFKSKLDLSHAAGWQ
jgi:hypothetical protein